MQIKSFPNGIFGATTYLVYDKTSKEAILIDCTSSIDEIDKIIKKEDLKLKHILITHGHFDHVYCLTKMKEKYPQTTVFIHKDDTEMLKQVSLQCNMAGIEEISTPCIDGLLDEKSKNITIGNNEVKIIHTKGHSKGGVCYLIGNILFSGDTLFCESIGRCDLYGGNFEEIKESITKLLFPLNEDTIVYPGHGKSTTIGHEKRYNPYFGSNY